MPCPRSSTLLFQQSAKRLRLSGDLVEFAPCALHDVGPGSLHELLVAELGSETSNLRVELIQLAPRVPTVLSGRGQADLGMKWPRDERDSAATLERRSDRCRHQSRHPPCRVRLGQP